MRYDYLINLFKLQSYGEIEKQLSIEDVAKRYALFPNEAIYFVDYKTAQIQPLTKNFAAITGIDLPHKNEVTPLYEHVHRESITPFLGFIENLLKYGFVVREKRFCEERDFNLTTYKTIHNRLILKSTTALQYDSNDRVRYSVGKLMDVTGLFPNNPFSYKFTGPGSKSIHAAFEGLDSLTSILSAREIEIVRYVGLGLQTKQIAERLFLSRHTVDTHKRNIIRKLEASNSVEAYSKARERGLIF
jgi:DNA-binding CsgD family transcriptional regulator